MTGLAQAWWLAAAAVWAVLTAVLAVLQRPALLWIETHVAERFRRRLTRYTRRNVRWHFLFLFVAGALLAVAAAGPFTSGAARRTLETRTVLLAIDASLSMGAGDAVPDPEGDQASRFDHAKTLAAALMAAMPHDAFGLVTFSGVTVVHSPPTRDHRALGTLLETLTYHVDLTRSGTRFSSAFDAAIGMAQRHEGATQVVLMSDGELPDADDYAEELEVLAELGVPVHAVGLGTTDGEERVIYHPDDVMRGLEEKRVAREYHTRRHDATLEAIARATGGAMVVPEAGGTLDDLLAAIRRVEPTVVEVEGKDREDLSAYPLAGFLVFFLIETLVISRRPRRSRRDKAVRSTRAAAAAPAVLALLAAALLLTGCRSRTLRAHLDNELGIGLYEAGQHPPAAARFDRSMSYRVRAHVPAYNLANARAAEGEFAVAHDSYQEALLLEPRLAEAHYNDGHALYLWGEEELDLEECRFERGRQLWTQARKRFQDAAGLAGGDLRAGAEANAAFLDERLEELDRLEAECVPPPPRESDAPPPPREGSPPPPQGGEPPPPGEGPPPPSGGAGGLSEDEKEQVRAALERIHREAAAASGYRQSRHQQITRETVGQAAGMELWW